DVVILERGGNLLSSVGLPLLPLLQEFDDVGTLRRIAEVVSDGWFENLRDQIRHASESRDDFGGIIPWNVDDLADIQIEGKAVGGSHRDGGQVRIQLVRFGLA